MNLSLEDIITLCKKGDRKAQKFLFERFAATLLTVSRQYTPKGLDPLDNLQDSFIKIFDRIGSFDQNIGSFEAWSRRIVINTALDKLSKKSIKEVLLEYEDMPTLVEDKIEATEDVEQLMHIIEQLPDGYKQVFCLYEIEGYSHKEIAEQLHIKEATSRSQLNKCKQMLRSKMSQSDEYISFHFLSE
ncbi:MAG: sigma-70 family RNA polymerase sigma factor [Saprospiraceae bacterium]|nr:sigma-70 family RNA polymerase sigma factor [Saprospiraceae bacterium]